MLAEEIRHARARPDGDGVVAAEYQRKKSLRKRLLGHLRQAAAGFRDLVQIFGALFAVGLLFGLLHGHVADVFHRVPQLFEPRLQPGHAQRRGAHVHAAAALAQVHRHADDANFLRHNGCSVRPNRRVEERANSG